MAVVGPHGAPEDTEANLSFILFAQVVQVNSYVSTVLNAGSASYINPEGEQLLSWDQGLG